MLYVWSTRKPYGFCTGCRYSVAGNLLQSLPDFVPLSIFLPEISGKGLRSRHKSTLWLTTLTPQPFLTGTVHLVDISGRNIRQGLAIAAQVDAVAYDFNTTISLTVTGTPFGYFVAPLQDSSNGLAIAAQVDAVAYDFNTTISPDISITSFFFSVSFSCGVVLCALSSFWKASSAFLS